MSGLQQGAARRPVVPKFAPADDYVTFCEAVRRICGVDLLQYKRGQMERRIRTWCARRGTADLAAYAGLLATDAEELDAFLDRVTINVSEMWRHPEQFTAVESKILPELAAEGRVRIWSAGCSYGAEAYTLAAICRSSSTKVDAEIKGTDLDRRMVARACEGVFSAADVRQVGRRVVERIVRGGAADSAHPSMRRFVLVLSSRRVSPYSSQDSTASPTV